MQQGRPQTIHKFWDFVAASADKPAELILYGEISSRSWWGDEITPQQFSDDLYALGDVSEIIVRINSGGGDVFAAVAIFTRLKSHGAKITVVIDGWAASAATIIAMAGDVVKIPAAAGFMIHDPVMGVMGYFGEEEFARFAGELTVTKNCIVNAYALKTGKSRDEISALMAAETWYTGEEAVRAGFCDEILFSENNNKAVIADFSRYRNMPKALLNSRTPAAAVEHTENKKEKEVNGEMEIKSVEDLRAEYPELAAQIADEAASAERKRIMDIESVALPGFEEVIGRAKFETLAAAADVAISIVAEQKKQGAAYLADAGADAANSGIKNVAASGSEGAGHEGDPYLAAVDAVLPKNQSPKN
jgi:ATP-dependent protease ClpP protease subunit